jgi:6-phosphogluconolactonase
MTIFRRRCLQALIFILSLTVISAASDAPSSKSKYILYVGTYTEKGSKGIYAFRYDAASSELTSLGVGAETNSPSFLAIDPTRRFLYAVNEISNYKGAKSGGVSAFSIDHKTGKLTFLNEVPSGGADPCYIEFDKTGKYVLVANYTGGSVAVFPVQADGHVGEASAFVQHTGTGPNPERQEGPHAHWIETTPDNRFAISVDLGLDELSVYRFDAKKGTLTPNDPPFAKLDPGAGPRHLAFQPDGKFAYVVNEIQSTVTSYSYDSKKGALQKLKSVSTIPKDFTSKNETAEIQVHPNGKFLFASNRGHDSIAVFSINANTGSLSLTEDVATQGKAPRHFTIDPTGKLLFVANEESNTIVVFKIDASSGKLTPTGLTYKVPSPVCLKFMAVE